MSKKKVFAWIFLILFLIVLPIAVYFTFFYYYSCSDISCFKAHQIKCDKTIFTNSLEDAVWKYKILGKDNGNCNVEVTLLDVKKGNVELVKLKSKSMICSLKIGSNADPESDVLNCHGLLKEELQQLMINKLHAYIISNLGQVEGGLENII